MLQVQTKQQELTQLRYVEVVPGVCGPADAELILEEVDLRARERVHIGLKPDTSYVGAVMTPDRDVKGAIAVLHLTQRDEVYVGQLFVTPDVEGHGLAAGILQKVLTTDLIDPFSAIRLQPSFASGDFYPNLGFAPVDVRAPQRLHRITAEDLQASLDRRQKLGRLFVPTDQ